MRSIAVINQKGGVGKTTTTANLAAALATEGLKVLAIDFDPQSHLTINLGAAPRSEDGGIYGVMTDALPIDEAMLKVRKNLWLLPSHIDLAAAETELVSVVGREVILRDAIEAMRQKIDYVLIDCPPSLGILTINALSAVKEVFIPLQPHFLALQGLGRLLDDTIRLVAKRINPDLSVTAVVLTMYEGGTRLANEVVDDVKAFLEASRGTDCPWASARVFDAVIRRNVKLAEAPSHGLSIFDYAPRCNGALDYARLAAEVLGKVESAQPAAAKTAAKGAPTDKTIKMSDVVATPATPPSDVANIV